MSRSLSRLRIKRWGRQDRFRSDNILLFQKSEAVKSVQDVLVKNSTEESAEEYEYEYYDDEEEKEEVD